MTMLKFISWNVNGLRAVVGKDFKESFAKLDAENETKIQAGISELVQGKTVIIIAHRMRTVLGADHIVVLDGGTVSEQGMPKELIAKGGEFAQMVKLQQENNNEK